MNSNKRGAVYGFKLQSLDMVTLSLEFTCFSIILLTTSKYSSHGSYSKIIVFHYISFASKHHKKL